MLLTLVTVFHFRCYVVKLHKICSMSPNNQCELQSVANDMYIDLLKVQNIFDIRWALISTELTIYPICKNTYTEPKLPPCLNAFCVRCLESLYRDKSPGDRASCPVCRDEGVKHLRHQFMLERLIDRERTDRSIL